jgi:hypothetical protein
VTQFLIEEAVMMRHRNLELQRREALEAERSQEARLYEMAARQVR